MKSTLLVICSLFLVSCGGNADAAVGGGATPAANAVEKKGACCSDKAGAADAKGDACCSDKAADAKDGACCSEKAADGKAGDACCAEEAAKAAPKSPN